MSDLFRKVHDQLPVFAVDCGLYTALYTPGCIINIKKVPLHELIHSIKNPDGIKESAYQNAILSILERAREAVYKWELKKQTPFYPECLTIHVGSNCNLNCPYCYSKVGGADNKNILGFPDSDAIRTLFGYILKSRTDKSRPFTVVFHGSGEPTFHWQKLVNAFHDISSIARQAGQQIFAYIATNGCLKEWQIEWLAENMDLIGISCDGPQSVRQKQSTNARMQFLPAEKVCEIISNKGGKFEIRTTVTPDSILELKEITTYIIEDCKAKTIRIEPVFLAGEKGFTETEADEFFNKYIESQKYAEQQGVSYSYAGIRMTEQHGTFCDILRNTLRLTADDVTRNCFCFMNDNSEYITGRFNKEKSSFFLSPEIQELKNKAFQIPDQCQDCINIYHCSRGCPDFCVIENSLSVTQQLIPFRCRLHQLIAVENIKRSAMNQKNLYS